MFYFSSPKIRNSDCKGESSVCNRGLNDKYMGNTSIDICK